jgi:hypothetical protein
MTLDLTEDPINTQNVVQYVVEEHEGHIQLLLIKDSKPGFGVLPKRLSVDWNVMF